MPEEHDEQRPGRGEPVLGSPLVVALLLVVGLVVAPSVTAFLWALAATLAGVGPPEESEVTLAGVLVQDIALLAGTLLALQRRAVPLSRLGLVARGGEARAGLLGGLALLLASALAGQISIALLSLVLGPERVLRRAEAEGALGIRLLEAASSPTQLWLLLFAVVVFAPLVEEIFFRGYVYQVFKDAYGSRTAYLLSAGLFAAVHAYVVNFFPVFVLGLGFVWLFERNGSLLPAIYAHSLFNGLVSLLALHGWGNYP